MKTILAAVVAAATLTACGAEDSGFDSVDFEDRLRSAEVEASETAEYTLEGGSDSAEQDPVEVTAWVCIGNLWCGAVKGKLQGNKLTVSLPVDPALVGLDIVATVPGVGVFKGRY